MKIKPHDGNSTLDVTRQRGIMNTIKHLASRAALCLIRQYARLVFDRVLPNVEHSVARLSWRPGREAFGLVMTDDLCQALSFSVAAITGATGRRVGEMRLELAPQFEVDEARTLLLRFIEDHSAEEADLDVLAGLDVIEAARGVVKRYRAPEDIVFSAENEDDDAAIAHLADMVDLLDSFEKSDDE